MIKDKKGVMNSILIQILLVALVFVFLLIAVSERVNSRDVRQQVIEKQLVLLIDSADEGMSFGIRKVNVGGLVDDVQVKDSRIFVKINGFGGGDGYPFFSRHEVWVEEEIDKFVVWVGER